jgi:RNA polymerase sigma factor (sigma-70 family)
MDDATLVEAARSGDGSAWAEIYDRYADKLHDHCHRILRDRDEAADALHDAFIAASRNLDQLRDPSRLRPWLYSICRHESLRRARQRSRVELTDEVDDVVSIEPETDRGARVVELQELVWSAAAGLNERDHALLDLNLRQGLEGQDLADAMGTTLNNSYVMLSRLRDQVERSLGALLIARLGRDECEELDGLLTGWDGRFSPLLRKRVARHVDGCEVCSERRAAVVSPLALLAAAPFVPAPAELRDRVLRGIGTSEPAPISFTKEGFAVASAAAAAGGRRRGAWLAAAAAVVLLAVVAALLGGGGDDETTLLAADGDATTTTAPAPTTTTTSSTTSTTTTVPAVAVPTTQPEAAPPTSLPDVVVPPAPPADRTPPAISSLSSSQPGLTCTNPTAVISAVSADASSAVLEWAGDPLFGSVAMTRWGDTWTATLGPFAVAPNDFTLTYTVRAVDAAGNTASAFSTIPVTPCPG